MASEFIRNLPKAELHLHVEGSLEPATLAQLSQKHAGALPFEASRYPNSEPLRALSEADVSELYQYKDFAGFLMAFKSVSDRLRTPEDYELVTYDLMRRLRSEKVIHAEVYVSAGIVHWRGQEFAPIFEGLERGRQRGESDFGVSLLWIVDAVRHFGGDAVRRVVDEAIELRKQYPSIVGIGIGGDEARGLPQQFKETYFRARDCGLRLTA